MDKYKVVALIGPAGSGKDFIFNGLIKMTNWHPVVHYTTRPRREGEIHGRDYWYVPNVETCDVVTSFRTEQGLWEYGVKYDEFDKDNYNLIISNPKEIRELLKDDKLDVQVYWIYASQDTRIKRQYCREENADKDEIARRLEADIKDFSKIDVDSRFRYIDNNDTAPVRAADLIIKWVEAS